LSVPEFSIVVPTFQRAGLVAGLVMSLASLRDPPPFECIVVVDGSTDGTADRLRALELPFPLTVIEQDNAGAAAARNTGAARATGRTLLFIDDDMVAEPNLLAEHRRSIADGAEVVLGHLPLFPGAAATILSRAVDQWSESRLRRLAKGGELSIHDMLTGQISINRALFEQLGGFDGAFTAGGSFGNEDIDLGVRLLEAGRKIVFNPKAITWQNYSVSPKQYLRQWHDAGRADVVLARKHPATPGPSVFSLNGADRRRARFVYRPLSRLGPLSSVIALMARALALRTFSRAAGSRFWTRFFFATRDFLYWKGVHEAGGIPRPHPVRVLCYHAVADLSDDAVLRPYGVPPAEFEAQIAGLVAAGYSFISAQEFARYLTEGGGLPSKPLLVTFDDCYQDLATAALPIMRRRGIRAVAFAVSDLLGRHNEWDSRLGRRQIGLLDAPGLRKLAEAGIEIGAHSRTHPDLRKQPAERARDEVAGSRRELEAAGLSPIRYFAYPYGAFNADTRAAAKDAGYEAAFSIRPGQIDRDADRFALPRIEVLRGDTAGGLRWKLWKAQFSPHPGEQS
jgi:peptidoglycan/xylan/chitin deacetylase (PgdA/CDA1 family)/glycosyltransferase involved in cell wall biosynthesis